MDGGIETGPELGTAVGRADIRLRSFVTEAPRLQRSAD